jgi:hypothetical protein
MKKNEIHCRVTPEMMDFLVFSAKERDISISEICRSLLTAGRRAVELHEENGILCRRIEVLIAQLNTPIASAQVETEAVQEDIDW